MTTDFGWAFPPGCTWVHFDAYYAEAEEEEYWCDGCGDVLRKWQRHYCQWCSASIAVSGQPDYVTRISDGTITYIHRHTGEVGNTLPLPVLDGD